MEGSVNFIAGTVQNNGYKPLVIKQTHDLVDYVLGELVKQLQDQRLLDIPKKPVGMVICKKLETLRIKTRYE